MEDLPKERTRFPCQYVIALDDGIVWIWLESARVWPVGAYHLWINYWLKAAW